MDWSIYEFSGGAVRFEGKIDLPMTFGTEPYQKTILHTFPVVRVPSAHNAIIGRLALNELKAIVSTLHLKMKFPTDKGVGEVCRNQEAASICYITALEGTNKTKESFSIEAPDLRVEAQIIRGISTVVIVHKLSVNSSFIPLKQKKRNFTLERQKHIKEEVDKLLQAGFIREIYYPYWLINFVRVKKANRKWWIRVDFTNLNCACPKYHYPSLR
ncbi:uncharacterized protein LOC143853907 [Tasmannia lanceolata]|uniref:uncharacterized protein LOC143853907 n=1 Tax=Tasmannia lanceolata TaxID=3420 RepID=UPI004062D1FC